MRRAFLKLATKAGMPRECQLMTRRPGLNAARSVASCVASSALSVDAILPVTWAVPHQKLC